MLLQSQSVFAQKRRLSGTVTDAVNHTPISGVSIKVKEMNEGASSKSDGTFQIAIRNGKYLVFSHVG